MSVLEAVYPVVIAAGTVLANVILTIGGHQPRCVREGCGDCVRTSRGRRR